MGVVDTNNKCSAYCQTCKTPTGTQEMFYTCNACYSDFIVDTTCAMTDCASCIPDDTAYVIADTQDGWQMGATATDNCGSLL